MGIRVVIPTIELDWEGDWDSAASYRTGDVVAHAGSSYRALRASQGVVPVAGGPDWDLVAQKGRDGAVGAQGTITVPGVTWVIPHNLGIPEELFNPASWWFTDENGNPMEPVAIVWVNGNIASAEWDSPVRGSWVVN